LPRAFRAAFDPAREVAYFPRVLVVASTSASVVDYALVVCLGSLVGTAELIARYRDAPTRALKTVPAFVYIGVNAIAAGAALALIRIFDWDFGQGGDAKRYIQVLVAGFGAIALFRSSLFIVRAGDQDIGIGPSSFLQVLLGSADRSVDRIRARERATSVSDVMQDVSFAKAHVALPTFCLALMQNVNADDQADLGRDIEALRGSAADDRAKVLALGLALMNVVGPTVLRSAVESLGDVIAADAGQQQHLNDAADAPEGDQELPPIPPIPRQVGEGGETS
jgi:hypothetical protein